MADGYMPQPDGANTCCDCPNRASPCDDCGCCPSRDCTEITGFTISGSATITACPDCGGACSNLTCSYSQTWTRINQADSYSADHQFKLYVDADCHIHYEDNSGGTHPTAECYLEGPLYPDFGIDWIHGSITLALFSFSDTAFGFTLQNEGDGGCFFDTCTATSGDTITISTCDVSPIIGTYTLTNTVTDSTGSVMETDGSLEIF